jgi:hypothetical protein
MKKSALKKYIKEQIVNALSEEAYELMGKTGTKTVSSFKSQGEANKFKQENPNIASVKKLEEKEEEEDVEVKDDYHKVDDEDDVKPVDAPAGDKEIQKKATKADIIIKTYKDLNQMLQRYKAAFLNAENETDKQEAFKIYKDFSQGNEYQNAKKKYVALKTIEL